MEPINRRIYCLQQATALVAEHFELSDTVIATLAPHRGRRYSWAGTSEPSPVFSFDFFDKHGGNCATYLTMLNSVQLRETPRIWGFPKRFVTDQQIREYTGNDDPMFLQEVNVRGFKPEQHCLPLHA